MNPPEWSPDALDPTRRAELVLQVRNLYADLAREQEAGSPPCYRRGDCCDFSRADHILFAASIETIYFRETTPADLLEPGLGRLTFGPAGPPPPSNRPSETAARVPCPYLRDGGCSVHETRPLGCRIYFCALDYQHRMGAVYEKYNARLRELSDRLGLPWRYAPFLAPRAGDPGPGRPA